MEANELPKNENGLRRWLCPDCACILTGPSYPKLHSCSPNQVLPFAVWKNRVQALKKIIDEQNQELYHEKKRCFLALRKIENVLKVLK